MSKKCKWNGDYVGYFQAWMLKPQCILCNRVFRDANHLQHLRLWEPGYNIFVLRFRPKTSSCQLPYQHPSSSANYARDLNGSDSLLDWTQKKFLVGGCGFFVSDVISEVVFEPFLAHVAWPRAHPLDQSISLKFSLEPRLDGVFWAFDQLSSVTGSNVMILKKQIN